MRSWGSSEDGYEKKTLVSNLLVYILTNTHFIENNHFSIFLIQYLQSWSTFSLVNKTKIIFFPFKSRRIYCMKKCNKQVKFSFCKHQIIDSAKVPTFFELFSNPHLAKYLVCKVSHSLSTFVDTLYIQYDSIWSKKYITTCFQRSVEFVTISSKSEMNVKNISSYHAILEGLRRNRWSCIYSPNLTISALWPFATTPNYNTNIIKFDVYFVLFSQFLFFRSCTEVLQWLLKESDYRALNRNEQLECYLYRSLYAFFRLLF